MPAPFVIGHSSLDIPRRFRRRGGFALLITITLLAFLVLLLVSLSSLTRVETQVATNSQSLTQARQNALLALNIALGRLQKTTGPDQRVTATADLQPLAAGATTDPASGTDLRGAASTTQTILAAIDTYWNASPRNRHWTGVWQNTNTATFDANNPSAANATLNPTPIWLVSGDETTTDAYKPTDAVTGLTASSTPLDDLKDASGRSYRLLVKTSADVTSTTLSQAVTAPTVTINATNLPGAAGTSTPIGHYAWWIGDEGIKARANIIDAYAASGTPADNLIRLQSAQRPALEAMTTNGTTSAPSPGDSQATQDAAGLAPFYPANNPVLQSIITREQLPFLNASTVFSGQLAEHYHDLTVVSRGVLSDARHGGLKHDLTYLLSRPSLSALHTALTTTLPGFAPTFPDTVTPTDSNRILSTTATPYATQPPLLTSSTGAFSGNNIYQIMDMFAYSATWEQLWSYYNMGNSTSATPAGVFDASGDAKPRLQTATQHGLDPLVIQVKLFYNLRIPGGHLDGDGVDRTDDIWMDITPVVVLANPYNVALEAQNYILTSAIQSTGRVRLYYGISPTGPETSLTLAPAPTTGTPTPPAPAELVVNTANASNNGLGYVSLTIQAPRMEPGCAYVFTLQNPQTVIPATAAAQKSLSVTLVNDFNPANALTFDTTKQIAAGATAAALTTDNGSLAYRLYTADYTAALGDLTMIRYIQPHTYLADSAANTILVYPLSSGIRHGGGMSLFIHDASLVSACQQTPTYQLNYRGFIVSNAAYTSFGTNPNGTGQSDIAISWARTRVKNGQSSSPGDDTPNEYIQSNLIWKDPSNPTQVRWGIYNTGDPGSQDGTIPYSTLSGDAGLVNILYDVPTAAHPPSSITQLRHFNTNGYIPNKLWTVDYNATFSIAASSFQPNYPIGDSYPNPYIIRQKVIDGDGGMGFQYDGSYLFNDALQDRFFFSTFPATGPFDFATGKLINNRDRPFRPSASVAWDDPAGFRTDDRSAAENLLVAGAFNINSTSVEAWKALLASLRGVPVGTETSPANLTAPFARTLAQLGASTGSRQGNTVNAWTGTINLTTPEIAALAQEIVLQIRRRGPFTSMADFLNRRLIASASDTAFGLGLSGALQAAIDRIFNQATDVQPAALRTTSETKAQGNTRIAENAFVMPTGISGSSGYILQSDLLSTLGPTLAARSDTFTIRTYGDAVNPVTGRVEGRAWCEAIVQRTPDYTLPLSAGGNSPDQTPAAGSTNDTYGRRYQIISFRWLSPSDL